MTAPTAYPEVNALLDLLLARIRTVLGERLVGLYLYGSATTGDYDAGVSDVDLLAAVASDLTAAEFEALEAMHRQIVVEQPEWDDHIEVAYLSLHGLQTFQTESSAITVISPGEPLNVKQAGKDWLMNWYLVREGGVRLFGPPASEIIAPTTNAERATCVRGYATDTPHWLEGATHRGFQAYCILTLCRAYVMVTTGEHVSKREAAQRVLRVLPEWAWLIESALAWRLASGDNKAVDPNATLDDTRRFARFMIDLIEAQPPPGSST